PATNAAASQSRNACLKEELDRLRQINNSLENIVDDLSKAKEHMSTVQGTVDNAGTLLGAWTRILSQTEHNQRLVLDPQWPGATQDMED
ncbi:DASH complex, subunit Duo1, partial [Piedraia hortae CBS 480.64]